MGGSESPASEGRASAVAYGSALEQRRPHVARAVEALEFSFVRLIGTKGGSEG